MSGQRFFMVVSYLIDENLQMVTQPKPIAGTLLPELAKEILTPLFEKSNGITILAFKDEIEKLFPEWRAEKTNRILESVSNIVDDDSTEKLLSMVDL